WTTHHTLEYLGRTDNQIKIRGFRIELGEIEAALTDTSGVTDALATVRQDGPSGRQLVGYVTTDGTAPNPAGLRTRLAAILPDYMVPAAVVVLDRWPLTPNGKIDRKALPAPGFTGAGAAGRAPRTPREDILASIYTDVLGLDTVTVDDSFFELGGDSISSMRVVSRARENGLTLTVQQVFQHRTVAELAQVATETSTAWAAADDGVGSFPMTPIMHWLHELGGEVAGFNQSATVRVPAGMDLARLTTSVQSWLSHHDILRLRMTTAEDGSWQPVVAERDAVAADAVLRRVDIAGLPPQARDAAMAEEGEQARLRLSPQEGSVVQLVWYDAGPETPGLLQIVAHHLAVDGVSWHILVPDLREAWEATAAGRGPKFAPVATSFRAWATRLAEAAQEPAWEAGLDVWSRHAGAGPDAPAVAEAPLGSRELDPHQDTAGTAQDLELTLPPERTEPLLTTVPAAFHASVGDVLLSAFALAAREWRRRRGEAVDGVLVDLEGHGREDIVPGADLSGTVGWFTSLYPVRLAPAAADWSEVRAAGPAVGESLKLVKEQLRALPGNGVGYGLLRHLNPRLGPVLAQLPAPQLGFNYLGRFEATDAEAGAGQPWTMVSGLPSPAPRDSGMPLAHPVEVNALTQDLADGPRLRVTWSWATGLLREGDVRELAELWFEALDAVTAHARGAGAGGHSPSDLSLGLSQAEIDELEAELRML
ncbi:condensation domain-containing protein, partial [Streptomyces sp. NPDC052496]|uniref:condensation domain-containing protein n=1 Tax=Streptomyces sp. NPDC052496 TaxID=3154951 RepID=UPI00341D2B4F